MDLGKLLYKLEKEEIAFKRNQESFVKVVTSKMNTEGETKAIRDEDHSREDKRTVYREAQEKGDKYTGSNKAIYFGLRMRCIKCTLV